MQSNSKIDNRATLGRYMGTCYFYGKLDGDSHLAYHESRMSAELFEAYTDGFMAGILGECKRDFPEARSFAKISVDDTRT